MERTTQNCARYFNLVTAIFFAHAALVIAGMTIFPIFMLPAVMILLGLLFVLGMLSYQVGNHPALTAFYCAGLFIPFASLIIFLIVYFQAKMFLVDHGYTIGTIGARPNPPKEAIEDEMDRLIREGKIQISSTNESGAAN
jgi:hypothetical protein